MHVGAIESVESLDKGRFWEVPTKLGHGFLAAVNALADDDLLNEMDVIGLVQELTVSVIEPDTARDSAAQGRQAHYDASRAVVWQLDITEAQTTGAQQMAVGVRLLKVYDEIPQRDAYRIETDAHLER